MPSIKRICVVGAGSIGSLYAGHLGQVAHVSVLARRKEHAAQLNRQGLRVSGKQQSHVRIRAAIDPTELGPADLVIIATKAFHVEQAVGRLNCHFPGALMMLVQNGLGCEDVVSRYGSWPIISAVTFMAGSRHTDTHVEYELDTATWLGPWAGGSATFGDAQDITRILEASGLRAEAFADLLPAQWSKLIFNATVNSICALTGIPLNPWFTQRQKLSDLGYLASAMIDEGKRVASANGVSLYRDPWEMILFAVEQSSAEINEGRIPSMLVDVRAQQLTEVDWITGALVKAAGEKGVQVPLHETLYRLVKGLELSWKINQQKVR